MKDQDFLASLRLMTIEEKLSLLSEIDKTYICGYIDRALFEQKAEGGEEGTMKSAFMPLKA
jgi:hypothetical protein